MKLYMRNLRPELREEYLRMRAEAGSVSGLGGTDITTDDVLCAYIILVDFFTDPSRPEEAESMLVGLRSGHLLASAVSRQVVGLGNQYKYTRALDRCATLFYGLVKDHAFSDGNKRVSLLTLLYHLDKFGYMPNVKAKEFEALVVATAANELPRQYPYQWQKTDHSLSESDRRVAVIARCLKRMTKRKDNAFHVDITSRELCSILEGYQVTANVSGGKVHFERRIGKQNWFSESRVRRASIPYRGDTRVVGAKTVRHVLSELGLYDQVASYRELMDGADLRYTLIDQFEAPLRRLKDR